MPVCLLLSRNVTEVDKFTNIDYDAVQVYAKECPLSAVNAISLVNTEPNPGGASAQGYMSPKVTLSLPTIGEGGC